ncbi:carbohydrate ABC transporter substrate-binding protein [Fredinandcohnia quinoae]|uniref:Carbohydrate ABC transporter substrate-binding protein n=1 Tax=Fredinandcohnia quinoae TaxID=2918902 RepID=A0AAW5E4A3_9BACI|nr:carbohydrate ABC transporter substrate-binding protein [Fredinandcohnia sp. SECRCQ15]MCH1624161.1 carbohydrate ABC transporter substrate-binding protein [Fredinandcohnia sp. SECRCQ15]
MKKKLMMAGTIAMLSLGLMACQSDANKTQRDSEDGKKTTLQIAALESAYGKDMWTKLADAYEDANPDVKVELTVDKNIEEVISPNMKAGNYPDVVLVATGRKLALTETLIKDKALEDITDVLDMNVYGEDVKVKDKLIPGFTDTLATNPYNDGKTYLAPMFYSPTGLFYNAGLLEEKGWEVPKTWDEMWELGEKAKEEGIALFTYPTTGYFDAFTYSLLLSAGGPDFYNKAMTYEDGIWETPEATKVFETVDKLAKYTEKTTVANANDQDFRKNQQLILDNKAIFMPNGTWVVGEMADAPRAEGFEWGMTALPAVETGGDSYAFTFFEQMWIPSQAKNKDAAKDFLTFVYSDKAAGIFAESNAIQPIQGMTEKLTGDNQLFYSIYDNGAKAGMGGFAATEAVEGVSMADTLFGTVNSIVSGDKSVDEWQKAVEEVSDKLRAALK